MRFHTTILTAGKTAAGIRIPEDVLAALGSSRKPACVWSAMRSLVMYRVYSKTPIWLTIGTSRSSLRLS